MDLDGVTTVGIDVDGSQVTPASSNDIGDEVTVTVSKPLDTLTGFFDFALGSITLSSSVTTRLEQNATYADGTFTC
jgi:hypothetical protein